MKKYIMIGLICIATFLSGCTQNERVMNYGGNMTIDLPVGERFENATWKATQSSTSLWYITRKREVGEKPTTHIFREKSTFGGLEGSVTFVEH
jgi:hypothetical protein